MTRTALRVAAVAIAVIAVIDPALTMSRSTRPLVSLLAPDSVRDAVLVTTVERLVSRQFSVVRGVIPSAVASLVVGDEVPPAQPDAPMFVISPTHPPPFVRFVSVEVPPRAPLNARIPITMTLQVRGASGREINVHMRTGDLRVEQTIRPSEGDTIEAQATFPHIATTVGTTLLHLRAQVEGTNATDEATSVIDVTDGRLSVLFYDPQASWLSRFVRRTIERDPRFAVTHRVVVSRGVSNASGSAPPSLRDARSLASYETIVVGSPEQLNAADVAGLEAFMRERGGRVVLLMDRRMAGPIDRLTGAVDWRAVHLPSITSLSVNLTRGPLLSGPSIRARDIAWPAILPTGASEHNVSFARDSTRRPVVWSVPVGAGRLLVSGALDAWQYRDEDSGFDAFWTSVIAELSAGAPRALELSANDRSIAPGHATTVKVWVREAALSKRVDRSATVSAMLVGPHDTTSLRLWPDPAPGRFSATMIAPRAPGTYRVIASAGDERSETSLVVDETARSASRDERQLLPEFAASRHGRVIAEADVKDLPRALASAIHSVSRVETWHPMRSAWWIVPFALLLGAEWWSRRRNGLA